EFSARRAFLRPGPYVFTGIAAAITQSRERGFDHKTTNDRIVDGLSRWAIKFGNSSSKTLLAEGVLPAVPHQDPRYKPSGRQGFMPRTKYAISRVFVAEHDDGHLEPNYSRIFGSLAASGLANIWEHSTPNTDRIGVGPTFSRFGSGIAFDVLSFVV